MSQFAIELGRIRLPTSVFKLLCSLFISRFQCRPASHVERSWNIHFHHLIRSRKESHLCLRQVLLLFEKTLVVSDFHKCDCFIAGPVVNGVPELSNSSKCDSTAKLLSVYTFQSDSLQKNASFAAKCSRGVLLMSASSPLCACKFFVPHFSSFGVSAKIRSCIPNALVTALAA